MPVSSRRIPLQVLFILLILVGLTFTLAPAATPEVSAVTISVTTTDDELDGDGDCSLREAIQTANTGAIVDACEQGTVNGPDVITLPVGTYQLAINGAGEDANQTGDLDISDTLTINGGGMNTTIVDANALDRAFHITSNALTVEINDFTISNGQAPHGTTGSGENGGAIYGGGDLTLISMSLLGNASGDGAPGEDGGCGGAVYMPDTAVTLTIIDSIFAGNHTGSGGSSPTSNAGDGGQGGAIDTSVDLSISGGIVDNNQTGAGGDSNDGSGGNGGHGGAIRAHGRTNTLLIENNTSFNSNATGNGGSGVVGGGGSSGGGGAVNTSAAQTIIRDGVTFILNHTGDGGSSTNHFGGHSSGGGAVNFASAGDTVIVSGGVSVSKNYAGSAGAGGLGSGSAGSGGGFYIGGVQMDIEDAFFDKNTSGASGGALYAGSSALVSIARTTLTNNMADLGGGLSARGSVAATDTTLDSNRAVTAGGGLIASSATAEVILERVTVSGNSAANDGGGAHVGKYDNYSGGLLKAFNSTFSGNSAARGGAVFVHPGHGDFQATNVTITKNFAARGGGIATYFEVSNSNSVILANSIVADQFGGGDCRIGDGAAITSLGGNLDSDDTCTLTQASDLPNNAGANLAPLALNGGATQTHALQISSAAINAGQDALALGPDTNPLAGDQRGAVYPRFIGTVDIGAFERSCPNFDTTAASEAQLSNAISCYNLLTAPGTYTIALTADIALDNSVAVVNNPIAGIDLVIEAAGFTIDGQDKPGLRPFQIFEDSNVTINEITISGGNTLNKIGGAILSHGSLFLNDSTVSGNQGNRGGGIFSIGFLEINNSTISDNSARDDGGGIVSGAAVGGVSTFNVFSSTISDNTAADDGGGLYASNSKVLISGSTVSGNEAAFDGGGVAGSGETRILFSTIDDNSAGFQGGGIFVGNTGSDTPSLGVSHSTISGNDAVTGGGIMLTQGQAQGEFFANIANSTISGNTVSGTGGGLFNDAFIITINNSTFLGNTAVSGGAIATFGACFAGDTQVLLADGSSKFFADLQVDDEVLSYDFATGTQVTATVQDTLKRDVTSVLLINGLEVTEEHPFAVGPDEWQRAGDLRAGDRVLSDTGWTTIESVEEVEKPIEVFNISVDGPNNYYVSDGAARYLVHNKPLGGSPGSIMLNNNIITQSTGNSCTGDFPFSGLNNLIDDATCFPLLANPVTNIEATLANNGGPTLTHALLEGSNAIDFGSDALALDVDGSLLVNDQRGDPFPRFVLFSVDAGAYEFGTTSITIIKDAAPPDGTDFPFTALGEIIVSDATAAAQTVSPDLYERQNANSEPVCVFRPHPNPNGLLLVCDFILDDAVPDDLDAYTDSETIYAYLLITDQNRAQTVGSSPPMITSFTIDVTEEMVPGWRLSALTCEATGSSTYEVDLQKRTVSLDVEPGRHVSCTFNNEEGEAAVINLIESYAVTRVNEGQLSGEGSKACTWVTTSVPLTGEVTLKLDALNNELQLNKTTVTLDAGNWDNLTMTDKSNFVCVRALDDKVDEPFDPTCKYGSDDLYGANPPSPLNEECGDHLDYVEFTISNSTDPIITVGSGFAGNNPANDFDGKPETVTVLINDNDEGGVAFFGLPRALALAENGAGPGETCYWVSLTSRPTAPVSVAIKGDGEVAVDKDEVVLNSSNWDNTWSKNSKVCVVPVNENQVDKALSQAPCSGDFCGSHLGHVTHTVSSSDPTYDAGTPFTGNPDPQGEASTLNVVISNDDVAGLLFKPGTLNLLEGESASYDMILSSQPAEAVNIKVKGSEVVFQPQSWDKPQTVTIATDQDEKQEGPETVLYKHNVRSGDGDYNRLESDPVQVLIVDDDTPGVLLSTTQLALSEDGGTAVYEVQLTSAPSSAVRVEIASDGQITADPAVLTVTTANWRAPQRVTVSTVDDAVAEASPHTGAITHTTVSDDEGYNALAVSTIEASIADNDAAGIKASLASSQVSEGGQGTTAGVVLDSKPTTSVVVSIDSGEQLGIQPPQLTFTPANWNKAQNVAIEAIDDAVDEGGDHPAKLSLSAKSGDDFYNGLEQKLPLTVVDNDSAGVRITTAMLATNSGRATYSMALTSQPTAGVVVDLVTADTVKVSSQSCTAEEGDQSCVLFTPENWNKSQMVQVQAAGEVLIEHRVSSSDAVYDGIDASPLMVNGDFDLYMPLARKR